MGVLFMDEHDLNRFLEGLPPVLEGAMIG